MGSSLLLGIEGLRVLDVQLDADGRRVAPVVTDPELAGWCPQCGEQSTSPKGWVTTRPRDVVIGPDVPILLWRKQKWRCKVDWCERKSFTESLPGIPARSRLTARLRKRAAEAIGDHTRSVSDVAGEYGHDVAQCHKVSACPLAVRRGADWFCVSPRGCHYYRIRTRHCSATRRRRLANHPMDMLSISAACKQHSFIRSRPDQLRYNLIFQCV
jgi:hypothetical protein